MPSWPAQPPLPTASNLPFQFAADGIQTSILISESLEGASVAAMRQNSGRSLYGAKAGAPGASRPAGVAANCPAGTVCARVIVVCGSAIDARLSHDAAATTRARGAAIDREMTHNAQETIFMIATSEETCPSARGRRDTARQIARLTSPLRSRCEWPTA